MKKLVIAGIIVAIIGGIFGWKFSKNDIRKNPNIPIGIDRQKK